MKPFPRITAIATTALMSVAFAQAPSLNISKSVVIIGSSPANVSATYNESVYIANLSLTNPEDVFNIPSSEVGLNASLAPDGRTVVVASSDVNTQLSHVRRISINGGAVLSHTTLDANASDLGFTNDSRWVTYVFPNSSGTDIYMAPVSGGASQRLTLGGNVSDLATPIIADNRLYYTDVNGVVRSEEFLTHRRPRVFPINTFTFTVSPSGDTIFYPVSDPVTGIKAIDSLDTYNGFHDHFVLDDQAIIPNYSLAVSQNEHFLYFTKAKHGPHGTGTRVAERLNIDTGAFSYPTTGITQIGEFITTGVNPNQ